MLVVNGKWSRVLSEVGGRSAGTQGHSEQNMPRTDTGGDVSNASIQSLPARAPTGSQALSRSPNKQLHSGVCTPEQAVSPQT